MTADQRAVALLLLLLAATAPALAKGGGGGGGAAAVEEEEEDDTDIDDDEVLNTGKRGKPPSHLVIKPQVRLGVRNWIVPKVFSVEAFVRDQQGVLDNPLSLRSSQVSGGLDTAYRLGGFTWTVTLQAGDVFSGFYEHSTRTYQELKTTVQQVIELGDTDWAITPKLQAGYVWSSDRQQQRWKFQTTTTLAYAVTDTVILLPMLPKLSYQPYTSRTDNRADWTLNVSAGIRWVFAKPSFLEATFGYENRWSNVPNAEFSRWVLTPKLNLRIEF